MGAAALGARRGPSRRSNARAATARVRRRRATATRAATPARGRSRRARGRSRAAGRRGGAGRRVSGRAPAGRATWRRSLAGGAEDDAWVEIGLAAHEPAGYLGPGAGLDDDVEALPRGVRDRHEHGLGARRREDALDVVDAADDGNALEAPPAQAPIVVDERDHRLARRLTELAQEASAGAAGADDQRPSAGALPDERAQRADGAALPEARRADQDGGDQRVDDEDAAREPAPRLGEADERVRHDLRDDDRGDDADGVAGPGVTPDAAIEAERDERRVAREQDHR